MRRGIVTATGSARRDWAALGSATAACAMVLALSGASPAPAKVTREACAGASGAVADSASMIRPGAALLCLLNRERAARDLRPVRPAAQLGLAARRHSQDMLRRRYFSHVSPGGERMADRVRRTGYARGRRPRELGETLACADRAQATPERLVRLLLRSPAHRDVVLDPDFRDLGIGLARGMPVIGPGTSGATLTLIFGRR